MPCWGQESRFFQNLEAWEFFLPVGQLALVPHSDHGAAVQANLDVGLQFLGGLFLLAMFLRSFPVRVLLDNSF